MSFDQSDDDDEEEDNEVIFKEISHVIPAYQQHILSPEGHEVEEEGEEAELNNDDLDEDDDVFENHTVGEEEQDDEEDVDQSKNKRKQRSSAAVSTSSSRERKRGRKSIKKGKGRGPHDSSTKKKLADPVAPLMMSPSEALSAAQKQLELRAVPRHLPCRELEREQLLDQFRTAIEDGRSGSAYISGVPGTGKTATVREVIRTLRREVKQKSLPPFKFVEVNGWRLPSPVAAFARCWQQVSSGNQKLAPAKALESLNRRFCQPRKSDQYCVVLLDELDEMVDASQSTIYTFFNWTRQANARITVVGIANTIDLIERLNPRIQSRLQQAQTITFRPYDREQLSTIIESRLSGLSYKHAVFQPDAIAYAARKIASMHGDARRALEVCRKATQLALTERLSSSDQQSIEAEREAGGEGDLGEKRNEGVEKERDAAASKQPEGEETNASLSPRSSLAEGLVTQAHVERMVEEMFCSQLTPLLQSCPLYQRLFLVAIVKEMKMSNSEHATFDDLFARLTYILTKLNIPTLSLSQTWQICSRLGGMRLLVVGTQPNTLQREVQLVLPVEEISYAIISDDICQRALE